MTGKLNTWVPEVVRITGPRDQFKRITTSLNKKKLSGTVYPHVCLGECDRVLRLAGRILQSIDALGKITSYEYVDE